MSILKMHDCTGQQSNSSTPLVNGSFIKLHGGITNQLSDTNMYNFILQLIFAGQY